MLSIEIEDSNGWVESQVMQVLGCGFAGVLDQKLFHS